MGKIPLLLPTALFALFAAIPPPSSALAADEITEDRQAPEKPSSADSAEEHVPGVDPEKPLSKQLHEDEGVIDPPPVGDSDIDVPAPDPDPGTTIVIPPPGSPGGDPTVKPK